MDFLLSYWKNHSQSSLKDMAFFRERAAGTTQYMLKLKELAVD